MRVIGILLVLCAALQIPAVRAEQSPRAFVSRHVAKIDGKRIAYTAAVEEFIVNNKSGRPAASLFATSYVRTDPGAVSIRPVVFLFNGGPSAAAIGVHMQFGPERETHRPTTKEGEGTRFEDNPNSILDVADLIAFDPAETGFSRVLDPADRPYFYSTEGDSDALAQLVSAWLQRHGRAESPVYLLGESYGSVRQVVTAALLAKRGMAVSGQIILGDSIFLMETSRRTHNIISTAVSLPLLAMTAAYHGKADKHGKSDAEFLDEVYAFATTDYLLALSKGYGLPEADRREMAKRLAGYTGIDADYYLTHGLTISKQDFNKQLLPGQLLDSNDTRLVKPLPAATQGKSSLSRDPMESYHRVYRDYMAGELKVDLPGLDYQVMAPGSFDNWDWGPGCNDYLQSAGLCNPQSIHPSVFVDYDWPEVLKRQFANPRFRAMIVAGYYDGLSSIGTHRYLAAQLGYPAERFSIHEYAGGHMTAEDPQAQPRVAADVRKFLTTAP